MKILKIKPYIFISCLFVVALLIRIGYLLTSQSTINAEEAALGVEALSFVQKLNLDIDYSHNRLYTISRYITALFFYFFDVSIFTLKSVSLFFSMLFIIVMWKLSNAMYNNFNKSEMLSKFTMIYVVFSPVLLNIWSLKARGGFIESLFIGSLILLLTIQCLKGNINNYRLVTLGYLWGLAFWIHPITIGYIITSAIVVVLLIKFSIKKLSHLFVGGIVGILPLIIINMFFNYNTFKYLFSPTLDGTSVTKLEKFKDVFLQAFPMFIGVKHEITNQNVYPNLIVYIIMIFFLILMCFSVVKRIKVIRNGIEAIDVIILFTIIHVALLIVTSWGSFLIEPRRALPLYTAIPFLVIYSFGYLKTKVAIALFIPIVAINIFSNIDYLNHNSSGVINSDYSSYEPIVEFLDANSINHVYTSFWYGYKVTFESKGRITWSHTPFLPSVHGFKASHVVSKTSSFIFDQGNIDQMNIFEEKLKVQNINFVKDVVGNIHFYFQFDREFNFVDVYRAE